MADETESKAQSPELAAGAGFTFEDAVGAYFLSALLDEGYAAGIENRTVVRVALQQRNFNQPLDDVIVDFRDQHGGLARLSLQVKRELTVSDAETNEGFRDVIRDCWRTYTKADFRRNVDRYGAAVGEIAKDKARDLIFLCEMARESTTTSHFTERFAAGGNASGAVKRIKSDIEALLTVVEARRPSDRELHEFLAHFVLEKFDFLHGGAIDPPEIVTRVRNSLATDAGNQAPQLWVALRQTVRDSAGKSGEFDRPRLVRTLAPVFRLRAAPSLRNDLEKITNLTRTWLADITNDVGGTHLDRIELSNKLTDLLAECRFVQIKGLPGSGKSVVLRQRLEADLGRGPVLFLKYDRLSGIGWSSFAASNGVLYASLVDLLVEIGATGSNTLFIDGIDRIEKEHRPVVLDVLRAVLGSPFLGDWKILVSLRDTGVEPLRNWLADVLATLSVATLDVGALDDGEAEALAKAKPHLRGLLFGAQSVREIVRRPFFAKILEQTGSGDFHPQSEVDLLENWWARGGYNAGGQDALDRQRALIDIGAAQARHLSDPVRFSELSPSTTAQIERLAVDGLVRHVKQGHTVRFAHDILFEWSFFHTLSDKGENWLGEVRSCGEPPAVARAVELLSQYEYREGKTTWAKTLKLVTQSQMRSQWTRAWLLGPIAASSFSTNEDQFLETVSADDFHFLRKALVWFQAERTTPNPTILKGELPQDQRIRVADLLGWPSDFPNWRRLLLFLLPRVEAISAALYPDVVSVFEVWQNALSGLENPISSAIVTQCAAWLRAIDRRERRSRADQQSRWDELDGLDDFRKSLINIILRAAGTVPKATEEYLKRLVGRARLQEERFAEVVTFSPILASTHPQLLVDLTLKHLKEELPDDRAERDHKDLEETARRREEARAKPESERTERDKEILEGGRSPHFGPQFSYYDWNRVCIDHDTHNFWPASPLREPFHSLFKSAPDHAVKLVNELCNHAITAWRQLHRHIRESPRPGTPIPLMLKFTWGTQVFWGGEREYLWYRGLYAPEALESGFRALEDWCFSELERGRPVDELIKQIVEGNQSVAILGVAVLLALQTTAVSETVFPLVTAQRLWSADHNRAVQDLTGSTMLLAGFTNKSDRPHIDALRAANARPVRKAQLRWLVPHYVLHHEFGERTRSAILAFKDNPPFQLEEHRNNPAAGEYFAKQAAEYAELADMANYRARKVPDQEGLIEVTHVSPSASQPENIAKAERATLSLQQDNLFAWASKVFENGKIGDPESASAAIELARKLDGAALYDETNGDDEIVMRRGTVAAVAAVILEFRENRTEPELTWARDVLGRASAAPETRGPMWCSQSVIPWEAAIFVARGLGADLRKGTGNAAASMALLRLVSHPLEMVSLAGLEETAKLWNIDPKLEWASLYLALTLCHLEPPTEGESRGPGDPIHSAAQRQNAVDSAVQYYRKGKGWPELPVPPPAWIKVKGRPKPGQSSSHEFERHDLKDPNAIWVEPPTHWHSQYAAKILKRIPYEPIVAGSAREPLLAFVSGVLEWTNAKNCPPWVKKGRRDEESSRLFEWNHELGETLGRLSGLLPTSVAKSKFLQPIFSFEGDACWALLAPFVSTYICRYVYDAKTVPDCAIDVLSLCLERFLKSSSFKRGSYHGGEFYGTGEPRLLDSLMLVSIEHASMAARFANGDWSEINLIMPIVDRFVRAGGWSATVMFHFLTLCERSRDVYPSETFADQILEVIGDGTAPLIGWRGTFIAARIAGLVQYFANRETPMPPQLGQKLLRVLDLLVDMGDRRSAALQLSENFREIKIATGLARITALRQPVQTHL